MKKILIVALSAGAMLASAPPTQAAFTPTDATWWTVTTPGTFTFTYLGFSASDTSTMSFVFNNQQIFVNNQATIGQQVSIDVTPGTYGLSLTNSTEPATWFSNPALNSDGQPHLSYSSDWSDFNLGALPAVAGNVGPYFGWADRALSAAAVETSDYNDLVFAQTFTPVPEPLSMMVLGTGLIGLGAVRYRRT